MVKRLYSLLYRYAVLNGSREPLEDASFGCSDFFLREEIQERLTRERSTRGRRILEEILKIA